MEKTDEAVGALMFRYFFEGKAIVFALTPQLLILTPKFYTHLVRRQLDGTQTQATLSTAGWRYLWVSCSCIEGY